MHLFTIHPTHTGALYVHTHIVPIFGAGGKVLALYIEARHKGYLAMSRHVESYIVTNNWGLSGPLPNKWK